MSETHDTDPVMFGGRMLPRVIAEALRFYARAEHYVAEGPEFCPARADGGARARAALDAVRPSVAPAAVAAETAAAADRLDARYAPVPTVYTNHAGLTQVRQIIPVALGFDGPWHRGQWHLYGLDAAKREYREFALSGFRAWGQGAVDERTEQLVAMGRAMAQIAVLADREPDAQAAFEILADAGGVPCLEAVAPAGEVRS